LCVAALFATFGSIEAPISVAAELAEVYHVVAKSKFIDQCCHYSGNILWGSIRIGRNGGARFISGNDSQSSEKC